jgi:CheY-like chemotaxis protein
MNRYYSALIIDDDPDAIAFMKWYLEEHFPWVRVASGTEADAVKGFDMYFIDNNFNGKARAVEIVKALRETEADALIIAYSATLDAPTFKALLNAGCNGAIEKGSARDMAVMGRMTKNFIDKKSSEAIEPKARGFRGTIHSMVELINKWNDALAVTPTQNEAAK